MSMLVLPGIHCIALYMFAWLLRNPTMHADNNAHSSRYSQLNCAPKARRTWWNKTEIKQNCRQSGLRFGRPSAERGGGGREGEKFDSFVLFQFQRCADTWNKADHRQHCLTAVYIRRLHIPETETLKQFRRVEKYAHEAETVSVFYFGFISPCATG